jgi:hypothetical protein
MDDIEAIKKPDTWYQVLRSALAGIQTPNLLIRSQMLYSIELRVRIGSANVENIFS